MSRPSEPPAFEPSYNQFMVMCRMWLAPQKPTTRTRRGNDIMRLHQWCKAEGIEEMGLTNEQLQTHLSSMRSKGYVESTIRRAAETIELYLAFLREVPPQDRDPAP